MSAGSRSSCAIRGLRGRCQTAFFRCPASNTSRIVLCPRTARSLRTSLACRPSGHPREPRLAAAAAHAVPPARRPPLHGRALGSWRYREPSLLEWSAADSPNVKDTELDVPSAHDAAGNVATTVPTAPLPSALQESRNRRTAALGACGRRRTSCRGEQVFFERTQHVFRKR